VSEFSAYRGDTASVNQFVASNDPHRPTVAFLGPGPRRQSRDQHDDDITDDVTVMYVGGAFNGYTQAEYHIIQYSTGISSRSLPPHQPPFQVRLFLFFYLSTTGAYVAITTTIYLFIYG